MTLIRVLWVFSLFVSLQAKALPSLEDPYLWLEDVEGAKSLEWVDGQNKATTDVLEKNPQYESILKDAKQVLFATDRPPFASFSKGFFWNFWTDAKNLHGVIRRTTYEEYRKQSPKWEVILDLDKLSKEENENWVFKSRQKLARKSSRWLMELSRGGKDASVIREFDYKNKTFVKDGFVVPEAKTSITPLDENTLLVATDFGPGSLTTSGYPRFIKLWKRGTPLADAKMMFEVEATDLNAVSNLIEHGQERYVVFSRELAFDDSRTFIQEADGSLRQLPIPNDSSFHDIVGGRIFISLKDDLKTGTRTFKTGSTISIGLNDTSMENAVLVFEPKPGQSVEGIDIERNRVLVTVLNNVRSQVIELKPSDNGQYSSRVLPLPDMGTISLSAKDEDDPTSFSIMQYSDFLSPAQQYRIHDEDGSYRLELLQSAPSRFDASNLEVVQNFATSKDGTKVPYFLIKQKNLVLDGSHPTILYGYGGFEVSLTPTYSGMRGKLWLERGGVYVIANIRGGGEFGPEWHQAALRENRQRAFDDFAAVAEDLIAKKITSPAHLGINGGSNGGLLTSTVMVQRPELMNAALIQVPLTDMYRFNKLLAGASWMAEYGNPDVPSDLEFLMKYSPYQNVSKDRKYPTPMFTTSTKDDRVHPAHSRKIAARMIEQGHPLFYYENVNGGHAGSSNPEETAHVTALEYTYLWQQLATPPVLRIERSAD